LLPVVRGVAQLAGGPVGEVALKGAVQQLANHFVDHSERLTHALHRANERAWKALELALAGDSFWEKCQRALARSEDQAFHKQVRAFLDSIPPTQLPLDKAGFRQHCLQELPKAPAPTLPTRGPPAPPPLPTPAGP